MATIESIMDAIRARIEGNNWPPPEVADKWAAIEDHRRYYHNDRAQMLAHSPYWNATNERKAVFTPVPLARDMARISSQLLFSESPRFSLKNNQEVLDGLVAKNALDAHLQEAGENVAVEGIGGLRVFRDDEALEGTPIIEYVPGDQVIWDVRHGRFVVGGAVVVTRVVHRGQSGQPSPIATTPNTYTAENRRAYDVYRLIEYHEPGKVSRKLYRGAYRHLGSEIPLDEFPEFGGLAEEEATLEGVSTLLMWRNVPNGHSDLDGLEALLDRVNDGFSYGYDKLRKSIPVTFVDRSIASESGFADLTGMVLTGDGQIDRSMLENAVKTVETVQPGLASDDHIAMVRHFMDCALEFAGYSRATWGRDDGGSADSGKALKLRQVRTLMTRAGKERMAVDAIGRALGVAIAWAHGGDVEESRPEIELGDGMPDDRLETAQELELLTRAEAISVKEKVKRLHPEAGDEQIDELISDIQNDNSGPQPRLGRLSFGEEEGEEE